MRLSSVTVSLLLAAKSNAADHYGNAPYGGSLSSFDTSSGRYLPYFPPSHPSLALFPDIAYAKNPTKSRRFAPPVPATPPPGDAVQYKTELPLGCFQYLPGYLEGSVATVAGHEAAMFQRGDNTNTTEDCLRLSIFAPKKTIEHAGRYKSHDTQKGGSQPLPVIIWVHGGGFSFGGINTPYQLAHNWVERSQSHIVVEIQYRLNLLGFPNAAGLESAGKNVNLGFLDQRLAVEWVRDNIGAFGGDPDRITLWGQSAGAYATDGYVYAWKDDPIVEGVIADSGNAVLIDTQSVPPTNNTMFSLAASRLGCGNLSSTAELDCMRRVPSSKIKEYLQKGPGEGGAVDDSVSFGAIVDDLTIFSGYANLTAKGHFAKNVDILIGTNTDEGSSIVPYNFPGSETATSIPASLQGIADGFRLSLQCATIQEARLRAQAGARSWQYLYGGNFTDISPRPWLGAYHTAELPLIFGTLGLEGNVTSLETKTSHSMQDLYLAFAEKAGSGLEEAGWSGVKGKVSTWQVNEWALRGKAHQLSSVAALRNECVQKGFQT